MITPGRLALFTSTSRPKSATARFARNAVTSAATASDARAACTDTLEPKVEDARTADTVTARVDTSELNGVTAQGAAALTGAGTHTALRSSSAISAGLDNMANIHGADDPEHTSASRSSSATMIGTDMSAKGWGRSVVSARAVASEHQKLITSGSSSTLGSSGLSDTTHY